MKTSSIWKAETYTIEQSVEDSSCPSVARADCERLRFTQLLSTNGYGKNSYAPASPLLSWRHRGKRKLEANPLRRRVPSCDDLFHISFHYTTTYRLNDEQSLRTRQYVRSTLQ